MNRDEAFTCLWDRHSTKVWAFAARRVGPAEADDVVVETFLIAWRRSELHASIWWLLGVARNVIGDRYRAEARRVRLVDRLQQTVVHADDATVSVDQALALGAAFASLSEPDQEALALVYLDDLAPADAARVVGCTAAAFRMRLMRARRALRRHPDLNDRPLSHRSTL